jgi:tetratricopeptide (TPR) repeat protein
MHSLSEPLDLTCGQCGRTLAFELWLIVDADERPDLLARAGALHTVSCSVCGPQGEVDAPLLLYLPDHNSATGQPPLIFSPAEQTSAEQDQQMAVGLLQELARRLGAAWQDDWLAQVASVRRELLPVALSDDPAAMREHLTQSREDAELAPGAAVLTEIAATLAAEGVRLESPADLERALAERPALAARLEEAVRAAMAEEDDDDDGDDDGDDDDASAAAATLPDLLNRFIAADVVGRIAAHRRGAPGTAERRSRRALRPGAGRIRRQPRRRAIADGPTAPCCAAAVKPALPAPSPSRCCRRTRWRKPSGMGLTPEEFLAQMRSAQQQMPPALREVLAELAAAGVEIHSPEELERRWRARPDLRAKVEAAMAEQSGPGFDIPPEVRPLLDALGHLTRRTDMPRRIELCRQALALVDRSTNPRLWAALQGELANGYTQNLQGDKAANLERAIEGYEQALQVRTRQAMPVEWATTQMNLATAYSDRIRGDKAANLERAIEGYEQALQVRTRQAMPVEWAQTMNNLATAYSDRIRGDKAANLERAIEGYEQALQVITRQAMPQATCAPHAPWGARCLTRRVTLKPSHIFRLHSPQQRKCTRQRRRRIHASRSCRRWATRRGSWRMPNAASMARGGVNRRW